jgi:hypothetical protein
MRKYLISDEGQTKDGGLREKSKAGMVIGPDQEYKELPAGRFS